MKRALITGCLLLLAGRAAAQAVNYPNNGTGSSIVGGRDSNGNAHTITTDAYGNVLVQAPSGAPLPVTLSGAGGVTVISGVGAAGVPDGGVVTIQGVDGGYPIPVSGSFSLTPSGTQNVAGTGTAGSPAGGVLTVQGNASGTPLPVSLTVGPPLLQDGGAVVAYPSDIVSDVPGYTCCATGGTPLPFGASTVCTTYQNMGPNAVVITADAGNASVLTGTLLQGTATPTTAAGGIGQLCNNPTATAYLCFAYSANQTDGGCVQWDQTH